MILAREDVGKTKNLLQNLILYEFTHVLIFILNQKISAKEKRPDHETGYISNIKTLVYN